MRTVKYNIEARLAHNSYMSTSPQGTSDGARPTTSTTTAPIAIPTAAANKQRYGQHQSTSLRAAEQQSQEARVSVSLSVSAPMGDARAFSTAAGAVNVPTEIVYAKLQSMVEGAALVDEMLKEEEEEEEESAAAKRQKTA